jgi:Phosphotransferase enzyme family
MKRDTSLPIQAVIETALAHGVVSDRQVILQNASTLVLRLSETLVARVVTDLDGPRQGSEWFEREIAVARFLAENGAPVIPLHTQIHPGPYEHLGYQMNFWKFVQSIEGEPSPSDIGETLFQCHEIFKKYTGDLPELSILKESFRLMDRLSDQRLMPESDVELLRERLSSSMAALEGLSLQGVHGDAHAGNLMLTDQGLLWADWEDAFSGPVEWDLASIVWNAHILENAAQTSSAILQSYLQAGGRIDPEALRQCCIARAAVICAWYPILYPNARGERKGKLDARMQWLASDDPERLMFQI